MPPMPTLGRPVGVISAEPLGGEILSVLNAFNNGLILACVPGRGFGTAPSLRAVGLAGRLVWPGG